MVSSWPVPAERRVLLPVVLLLVPKKLVSAPVRSLAPVRAEAGTSASVLLLLLPLLLLLLPLLLLVLMPLLVLLLLVLLLLMLSLPY